jgi:hypothetical protein
MNAKRKVTYTFYTDDNSAREVDRVVLGRKIRMASLAAGENMSDWARELDVTPQAIYRVVDGLSNSRRVREFIESRLNVSFWHKVAKTEAKP